MNKKLYAYLFFVVVILDRATKYGIYHYLKKTYAITPFLSFDLTFNRGITWCLFNSGDATTFFNVNVIIMFMYGILAGFTFFRLQKHFSITAEVLILAGGLSNIIDRFIYGGVIDFIVVGFHAWTWPVFNVADAFIVLGVFLMGVTCLRE